MYFCRAGVGLEVSLIGGRVGISAISAAASADVKAGSGFSVVAAEGWNRTARVAAVRFSAGVEVGGDWFFGDFEEVQEEAQPYRAAKPNRIAIAVPKQLDFCFLPAISVPFLRFEPVIEGAPLFDSDAEDFNGEVFYFFGGIGFALSGRIQRGQKDSGRSFPDPAELRFASGNFHGDIIAVFDFIGRIKDNEIAGEVEGGHSDAVDEHSEDSAGQVFSSGEVEISERGGKRFVLSDGHHRRTFLI